MRLATLALLAASSVSAQSLTWAVTVTPENGGTSSRISWTSGGTFVTSFAGLPGTVNFNAITFGGNNNGSVPFSAVPSPSNFSIGSTGIIGTNSRTEETVEVTGFRFIQFSTNSFLVFALGNGTGEGGGMPVQNGDVVTFVVPTSGSYVINQDFSLFNSGFWSTERDGGYINTLTIGGAPVPEPSTYGLALGGLALAGVAIRRRKRAK
jgi:hypothetical protein